MSRSALVFVCRNDQGGGVNSRARTSGGDRVYRWMMARAGEASKLALVFSAMIPGKTRDCPPRGCLAFYFIYLLNNPIVIRLECFD